MSANHLPEGYHSVTPSLTARDARAALDFYSRALGAEVLYTLDEPSGKVAHGEFTIGNSRIMISDEYPDFGAIAPEIGKGATFMIYVPDVDAAYARAVKEGGEGKQEPTDMFWGDRIARIFDPYGYRWTLATRQREVSVDEMKEAMKSWGQGG